MLLTLNLLSWDDQLTGGKGEQEDGSIGIESERVSKRSRPRRAARMEEIKSDTIERPMMIDLTHRDITLADDHDQRTSPDTSSRIQQQRTTVVAKKCNAGKTGLEDQHHASADDINLLHDSCHAPR